MKSNIITAFIKYRDLTYSEMNAIFKNRFGFTGKEYVNELKEMFIDELFPTCAKVVISPWTGTREYFRIILKDETGEIITQATVDRGYSENSYKYRDIKGEYNAKAITKRINAYKAKKLQSMCKAAGLDLNGCNSVVIRSYGNYKPTDKTSELNGTISEIIDKYTDINDHLRYCNGSYWRWESPDVNAIYNYYIENYDGNYFLNNAVKNGRIID